MAKKSKKGVARLLLAVSWIVLGFLFASAYLIVEEYAVANLTPFAIIREHWGSTLMLLVGLFALGMRLQEPDQKPIRR